MQMLIILRIAALVASRRLTSGSFFSPVREIATPKIIAKKIRDIRLASAMVLIMLVYKHKIKNSSLNVLLILTKESISLNSEIAHFSFNKFAYLTDFDRQSFDFHFKGDRMLPVSCGVTVRRDENRPFERGREKTFPLRTVRCAPSPLGRGIGGSIRLSFDPHRRQAGNISPSKIKYPPSRET